jgi:capsular exopolysaccharide synthesis family protein
MDARSTDPRVFSKVEPARDPFDWRRQALLFRRRFRLFLFVMAMGCGLSAAAVLAIPVRYVATAEIVIDPHRQQALDLRSPPPDGPPDTAAIDTEVELLKSRALARKVAEAFGLDRDPEFNPSLDFGLMEHVLPGEAAAAPHREAILDRLERRLKVARVGFTYVISISVASASPDKAASLANAFTALYLQDQLDAKSVASRRASNLLSGRLGGLREEVDAAEHAVEQYKAAHGLMTLADSQGATTTEQEISSLDAQLIAARGQEAEAKARLAAATAQTAGGGAGDDLGEVLNSPMVQELRKQRDEASKQIAELQGRYGQRHPELLKAQRQRAELDVQISQEIARVISNLRVQVQVAQSHAAAIAAAVAASKAQLAKNNNASVELKQLEQNLDAVRSLYQSFLDRSKQTLAQDGMAQADARLVQTAKPPVAPAWPNRLLLFGIGLTASILAALLAIWAAEVREDGLYAPDDVEARLGLACLGLVPAIETASGDGETIAPPDVVLSQPLSGFAESFRAIKSGLLLARSSGPIRTIAVTSALPGEGKTTTSMCLGRIMARSGSSTVVVDCDLRRRAVSRLLSAPPRAGLMEVLSGAADLEDALISDGESGLFILPLGNEEAMAGDVFESPAMGRLLEGLRRRFRVVLLDTAPVLMVAETTLLAGLADAVLFVARWGKTPTDVAASAVRRLESAGAYISGAALTQADLRRGDARAYPYAADYYPFYRTAPSAGGEAVQGSGRRRFDRRP